MEEKRELYQETSTHTHTHAHAHVHTKSPDVFTGEFYWTFGDLRIPI